MMAVEVVVVVQVVLQCNAMQVVVVIVVGKVSII